MHKILPFILVILIASGCKKSSTDLRRIPNGTMVKMESDVKLPGSTAPFVVDSLYSQGSYDMNFYYCTDAAKHPWIIPDDDLVVIK